MEFRAVLTLMFAALAPGAAAGHWAYVEPEAVAVPASGHPVDAFLGQAWRDRGLTPAPLAEPVRWLERAAYTLTGLPPSAAQLERIRRHPDEATWSALVEELLASPAYGERWARHWMDVARYADTRGYHFDNDNRYPYAYTYRDWLIRAFNADLPYDRFVTLQLAADHRVDRPDHPDLAALGLLTVGPRGGQVETLDDRVDVITRGFMATTVSCARCHDHKTDPILQEDYYSFFSIVENAIEDDPPPRIGEPADDGEYRAFLEEKRKLEEADLSARQAMVEELRSAAKIADYLALAWQAREEDWDHGRATAEGFKRGRCRPGAILRWREFLKEVAWGEPSDPRLAAWASAMQDDEAARRSACVALADEWAAALSAGGDDAGLRQLAGDPRCPLSYDADRIHEFHDQQDGNEQRQRQGAMARLETEHPGAPPRAMSVRDRETWHPAQVYRRGNPGDREPPFDRHWLGVLGGEVYGGDKSPRLAMAERIASRSNPLTARVMVNRVWAWHFGAPLVDPGDFGPQTGEPPLRAMLDWLAVRFMDRGWSLKELHRLLLHSEAFRRGADGPAANDRVDQANASFWKWNRRRLDFESMRDHLLASSGALDLSRRGGRSLRLEEPAADSRRSLYAFVDRYQLPGVFVNFDLPHPDHHAARRVETTVPQQALFFLNNALPIRQAVRVAGDAGFRGLPDDEARARWIYRRLLRREASPGEVAEAVAWVRAADPSDYEPPPGGHWEIRHAADTPGEEKLETFPMYHEGAWKTGPELARAPIRWLHAGRGGGHAAAGRRLVVRWRAHAPGEVRMSGWIERSQQGGAVLAWSLRGPGGGKLKEARLDPESRAELDGPWTKVATGDTIDFVLRAPDGDACGGFRWDLRVEARERGGTRDLGRLADAFPETHETPPPPGPGDPWADLVQAIWAGNEFQHVD
mgnify:CR=1 FL=1